KGGEPYLSALTNYLKEPAEPYHVEEAAEKPQWFSTKEVLEPMRHKAKLFIDFAEANKENNNIKFLTSICSDAEQSAQQVLGHPEKSGQLLSKNLILPVFLQVSMSSNRMAVFLQ
ncbi:neoverrucotoxin subunit alpha-like isoform X1, partial [Lates japonicus]